MFSELRQLSWGKGNGYMFDKNFSSLEHQYKQRGACFNKKKGEEKVHISNFLQQILILIKRIKN